MGAKVGVENSKITWSRNFQVAIVLEQQKFRYRPITLKFGTDTKVGVENSQITIPRPFQVPIVSKQ